ncbi:MAG TPA: serine/threonine-protein kinase [Kofleriaceae bacterium]
MRDSQDTDDTVPAESSQPANESRTNRPTIPDLAPPFEQRYRLGVELGRGGMGRVVEAFDTQLGRTVALKEVLPRGVTSGVDKRFEREVQITARLEHPSIVPLYDAGSMPDGRPFYVMRRVTGQPLDELIGKAYALEDRLALLPNMLAATDAVAHAHKRGIIHRDLKPANILVGENGETIVIDWGLAKVIDEDDPATSHVAIAPMPDDGLQTVAGAVFGTPGFMAPEQARGEELQPAGDVFALGACLYQLLVGKPPIAGRSATEAIAHSMVKRIVPVAQAAPHAPVELVAIVEKAMQFDQKDRYPHAGGLAEDLRSFLTGQVVAAHRYTRRELIARFAKKHRAPLSVAALATVAVAVLAWIGVHRILVERDSANVARAEAEDERSKVLKANAMLVERADALLITRARALVDSNPTESLALLKDLKPSSPKLAEARAIASAAVMRGVPWALKAEGAPRRVSVDPAVSHLAVVSEDGTLHVWDLDRRRVMFERMYQRGADAVWVAGAKLLLTRGDAVDFLDPRTGVIERLSVPASWHAVASEDGAHVALLGAHGELGTFDVGTRVYTPLWDGHETEGIAVAPDWSWIAATDKAGLIVMRPDGTKILERKGEKTLLEGHTSTQLGIFDLADRKRARVYEVDLTSKDLAWREDPLPATEIGFPLTGYYRANLYHVIVAGSVLHFSKGKLLYATPVVEFNSTLVEDVADELEINASRDGTLHVAGGPYDLHIHMPVALSEPHLAGHKGQTRFVAVGDGIVLIYDLAEMLPRLYEKNGEMSGLFMDDDTLLMWPDDVISFYSRDLKTGAVATFKHEFFPGTFVRSVDPATGRVLLLSPTRDGQSQLVELQKPDKVRVYGSGHAIEARLAQKGFITAHDTDPRVLYAEGDQKPRELIKVEGGVQSVVTLSPNRYAALGRSGELVRGDTDGGSVERMHVDIDANAFVAVDAHDRILVAARTKLFVWDTGLRPIAELPRAIAATEKVHGGILVSLDNNAAVFLDEAGKQHDVVGPSTTPPWVGGGGSFVATAGSGGQLTIIEVPSLSRWTLPQFYSTSAAMLVGAPNKRRLMQAVMPYVAVYDLPEITGELSTWLDAQTNAFESIDGIVSWPWLRP